MGNDMTPDFIQQLLNKIDTLTAIIEEQTVIIAEQAIIIAEQAATINKLTETVANQQQEIAKLKEQHGKNSKNSSKPPSSDGFKKPQPKALENLLEKNKVLKKGMKVRVFLSHKNQMR